MMTASIAIFSLIPMLLAGLVVVLVAVGRRPFTNGLGLAEAGVKTTPRGFVSIDCPHCRTLMTPHLEDSKGALRWPTWYVRPYAPFALDNPFLAWKWVNERVLYDHPKADRSLPGVQLKVSGGFPVPVPVNRTICPASGKAGVNPAVPTNGRGSRRVTVCVVSVHPRKLQARSVTCLAPEVGNVTVGLCWFEVAPWTAGAARRKAPARAMAYCALSMAVP